MEEVAQGSVWTGEDAASRGLVDAIGSNVVILREKETRERKRTKAQNRITKSQEE